MKRYIVLIALALASCAKETTPAHTFQFNANKYHLDVIQLTPLGCTYVEDDVYLSYNGMGVSLNDATGLLDGEHINLIAHDQSGVTRVPLDNLYNRMVEQYTDSALLEFGTLHVYIIKE